jgi:Zn-dependent peptidase ImmA (M78 family)
VTKSLIVSPRTASDIDQRVDRILRGLGNPQPPLKLEDLRELLKLDLQFYTSDNPSLIQEVVSRMRVGAKQIIKRPTLLFDAISKFSLRALYLPDRKRILLDKNIPQLKHRWNEAHEIGHSILPWHDEMMHGDTENTLSQHCHEHIEAEANFAAGRLLFLRDRFTDEALSLSPQIVTIQSLQKTYGNTMSTTLYRFVESIGAERPVVGVITGHPHIQRRSADYDPKNPCRHFIQSLAFSKMFGRISEIDVFKKISGYCGNQRGGMLGREELLLSDDNGDLHRFSFETFYNRYDSLTLGVHIAPEDRSIFISAR